MATVNYLPLVLCTHKDAETRVAWTTEDRHVSPQEIIERMMDDIEGVRHSLRNLDEELVRHREALRMLLTSLEHVPEVRKDM